MHFERWSLFIIDSYLYQCSIYLVLSFINLIIFFDSSIFKFTVWYYTVNYKSLISLSLLRMGVFYSRHIIFNTRILLKLNLSLLMVVNYCHYRILIQTLINAYLKYTTEVQVWSYGYLIAERLVSPVIDK